jgi:hypothetical protein
MSHNTRTSDSPFDRIGDKIIERIFYCLLDSPDNSMTNSIWALSLCSRRFRRISLPFIFYNINLDYPIAIYAFFKHLIDFPQRASLVRTISFHCYPSTRPDHLEVDELDTRDALRFAEEDRKLSLPAGLISELEKRAPWAVALCLLPLLTNVEGFHIESWQYNDSFRTQFIGLFGGPFLRSNLRWVSLSGHDSRLGTLDVEVLVPLFLSQSITKISASRVESRLDATDSRPLIPVTTGSANRYNSSKVNTLQLYDPRLPEGILAKLLSLPKALKMFEYMDENEDKAIVSSSLEDLRQSIDIVSHSLEALLVKLDDGILVHNSAWSFHHFKSLKVLSVSYKLLWDLDPELVIDRLPPSLQTLILWALQHSRRVNRQVSNCFKKILMEKSPTVLAHLRRISWNSEYTDWSSLIDLALEKEVKIIPAFEISDLEYELQGHDL